MTIVILILMEYSLFSILRCSLKSKNFLPHVEAEIPYTLIETLYRKKSIDIYTEKSIY
ncbi:hypothetical protein [Okeania sp. SIO2B3]|uniref:hypothetical protein n=1 Tax=Okeania sp. SIO2B3 TaxID=2607784 RepID=UPI0013C03555|nr:hypothetical protein [Okeania sp. SIO2B3]NET46118.1 hypothetical protein [Okeania sp. SIO2B3]